MTDKLIDIYYTSATDAEGVVRQDITVRLRDEADVWTQKGSFATLSCFIAGDGTLTYKAGQQSIETPENPELLTFEAYFREDIPERFEEFKAMVAAVFEGSLNSNTNWQDLWGLRLITGKPAAEFVPGL